MKQTESPDIGQERSLENFIQELRKIEAPKYVEPRQVLLFSGHMVDAPARKEPRFPAEKEALAALAISDTLDKLNAGPEDIVLCSAACGGDILFAEACLARGLHLEVRIPFEEEEFLHQSVSFAGDHWRARFYAVKAHTNTTLLVMSQELGALPTGKNAFVRVNLWLLYTALAWGPEKVRCILLWNRKEGDGPGGAKHFHDMVAKYSGRVYVLDTTKLW